MYNMLYASSQHKITNVVSQQYRDQPPLSRRRSFRTHCSSHECECGPVLDNETSAEVSRCQNFQKVSFYLKKRQEPTHLFTHTLAWTGSHLDVIPGIVAAIL